MEINQAVDAEAPDLISTQVANLTVGSERVGPHAFLVDMASPGISTGDMGIKTTGNDLDNAWIAFDKVRVPRSALLDAHCAVSADGTYARTTEGILPFRDDRPAPLHGPRRRRASRSSLPPPGLRSDRGLR